MRNLFLILVFSAIAPQTLLGQIQFVHPTVDLGTVRVGSLLKQEFLFQNVGSTPLTITEVRASCGCLAPKLEKTTWMPQEKGTLLLQVNTLTQPAGSLTWRVDLRCRHQDEERHVVLALKANLVAEIRVEPPGLQLYTDRELTHTIMVKDSREKPLRVTRVASSCAHLTARAIVVSPQVWRIEIKLESTLPQGNHEELISIFSDDPQYPELRVPVRVSKQTRGAIHALPEAVTLTIPRGQSAPSQLVMLRSVAELPVHVERVAPGHPAVTCRWAAGPGNRCTLRISVDAQQINETLKSEVMVHLRDGSTVRVPLFCTVR